MTEKELERKLADAVRHTAPDDLEGVLSRCEMRKGNVIPMAMKKKRPVIRNLAAACLALALIGGVGGVYQSSCAVASVVSLDVNPSIELAVNRREKVLSCTGLNQEGQEILADMAGGADLEGTKLEVAVNAVVGALVRYGYLDSISSAILISVEDKDRDRAARLREELTGTVDAVLQQQSANAAVLSQTVARDDGLDRQAKENNISTGKAYLVRRVMEMNGTIAASSTAAFEKLSNLSVEELNDLLETGETRIPIGKYEAQFAVEEYAGTVAVDAVTTRVDAELDERVPHYEVELTHPTLGEFEYQVDAFTGEILSGQKNIFYAAASYLTEEQALEKAKEHMVKQNPALAGQELVAAYARLEKEDERPEYKIEFYCGGYEFDYEVDARTGAVLEWDQEKDEKGVIGGSVGHTYFVTGIDEGEAKAAALAHAGLTESQVAGLKGKLDEDNGHPVYEVEFHCNSVEYDYEIDALDGEVWKYETNGTQTRPTDVPATETSSDVGADKAKAAALAHAGLTESQVTGLKAERDQDDGRLQYEVEFKADGLEYEYTIDGSTGAVLEHEKDQND